MLTVPKRFAEFGDPHAEMDQHAGSLEKLLELADATKRLAWGRAVAAALSEDGGRRDACRAVACAAKKGLKKSVSGCRYWYRKLA